MGRPIKNILKKRFGNLVAEKFLYSKDGHAIWVFSCDCGKPIERSYKIIMKLKNKSCGCTFKTNRTHGFRSNEAKKDKTLTKFYTVWCHIVKKCGDQKSKDYIYYGGRGIKNEWSSFEKFKNDMFESYKFHVEEYGKRNTTIDRVNTNGNYSKENCQWATWKQQENNRTNNHFILYEGKKKTLTQWAEEYGMTNKRLWARLNREKLPIHEALTKELRVW